MQSYCEQTMHHAFHRLGLQFEYRMIYCNTLPYTLDWSLAKTLTPSRHSAHAIHGSERVACNRCPPQAVVQNDTSPTAITEPVIATAASRDIT